MPRENSAAFAIVIDRKEWKEVEKAFGRFAQNPFDKREKVSVGGAGTGPVVPALRAVAKRRPATAPVSVFYRGGLPRFAHLPGNLSKAIRRTPQAHMPSTYFAWVGVAMKNVKALGEHTVVRGPGKGSVVPLYGQGVLSSYAPYAYKAYGDSSGSSYTNWSSRALDPAVTRSKDQSQALMIKRTFEILDKKLRNAGFQ